MLNCSRATAVSGNSSTGSNPFRRNSSGTSGTSAIDLPFVDLAVSVDRST